MCIYIYCLQKTRVSALVVTIFFYVHLYLLFTEDQDICTSSYYILSFVFISFVYRRQCYMHQQLLYICSAFILIVYRRLEYVQYQSLSSPMCVCIYCLQETMAYAISDTLFLHVYLFLLLKTDSWYTNTCQFMFFLDIIVECTIRFNSMIQSSIFPLSFTSRRK